MALSLALAVSTAILAAAVGWLVLQLFPRPLAGFPQLATTRLVVGDTVPLFAHYANTQQFHRYLEQLARDKGGAYQFLWTGSLRMPSIVLTDWHEVQDILGRRQAEFDRSPSARDVFKALLPFGLLSLDASDPMWREHKRLLTHSMSPKSIKAMAPTIISTTRRLLDLWAARLMPGGPGDLLEVERDLSALTTDIISEIVFGAGYHQLDDALFQLTLDPDDKSRASPFVGAARLAECSRIFFASLPSEAIFFTPAMLWTRLTNPAVGRAERFFHAMLGERIADGRSRVRSGEGKDTMLDQMLEKEWEGVQQGGRPMAESEIRDELATMLVAGDETTSSTMCWLLQYLAQHPTVQTRLHEETKAVLPSRAEREPSLDDLASQLTPYLDAVIHETLRLSKTVSAVYRTALVDTTIQGVLVPKGTDVVLLLGHMGVVGSGLDGGVPSDMEDFRPERWLAADGLFDAKRFPMLPFSKGSRECIGKQLAMVELKVFAAMLSQTFFLDALPKEVAEREAGAVKEAVTRRPSGGVSVKLRRWEAGA